MSMLILRMAVGVVGIITIMTSGCSDSREEKWLDIVMRGGYSEGESNYMIVDIRNLRNESTATKIVYHRIAYFKEIPRAEFGKVPNIDILKKDVLVFRKIKPDSPSYSNSNEKRKTPSKPYWIGIFEVTQKQYQHIMGTKPSRFKGDMLPVEQISWDDAYKVVKKLKDQIGLNFTLPTSIQWEYACNGAPNGFSTLKGYIGPLGPDMDSRIDFLGWYAENSEGKTHPVGTKSSNKFELYDMHGNVEEWCLDGEGNKRFCCGGSWYDGEGRCRSFSRYLFPKEHYSSMIGFRLACPAF